LADRRAVKLLNVVMRLLPSGRVLLVFLQVSWPGSSKSAMVLGFKPVSVVCRLIDVPVCCGVWYLFLWWRQWCRVCWDLYISFGCWHTGVHPLLSWQWVYMSQYWPLSFQGLTKRSTPKVHTLRRQPYFARGYQFVIQNLLEVHSSDWQLYRFIEPTGVLLLFCGYFAVLSILELCSVEG
jgi:hypothetical protein